MTLFEIGAGIAAVAGLGAGVGIGIATNGAVNAVARQPELEKTITKLFILGCALAESTAIYGLVISFIILFAVQ